MTRLEFLRLSRRWTLRDMERATGIHRATCSKLCNGWFARVSPSQLAELQRVFGDYSFQEFMKEVKEVEGTE